MTQANLETARHALAEIGRKIEQRERDLAEHGVLENHHREQFQEIASEHERLRRKLHAQEDATGEAMKTIHEEVQSLRDVFERWASSIDGLYAANPKRSD